MNKNKVLNQHGASLVEIIMSVGILSAALSFFMIQSSMNFKVVQRSKQSLKARVVYDNIVNIISSMPAELLLATIVAEKSLGRDFGDYYDHSNQSWIQEWIDRYPFIKSIQYKIEIFKHQTETPILMSELKTQRDIHMNENYDVSMIPASDKAAMESEMLKNVFLEYHKKITTKIEYERNNELKKIEASQWKLGE